MKNSFEQIFIATALHYITYQSQLLIAMEIIPRGRTVPNIQYQTERTNARVRIQHCSK